MKLAVRMAHRTQGGFTLVWALAAVAIVSVGLATVGPIWADQARRDREQELLRVGQLYAQAIAHFRLASPGSLKQYPPSLDQLLADGRFAGTVRYLRKLYPDPMEPSRPWGLVRDANGAIIGVFSQSAEHPLRREPLVLGDVRLPSAERYDQWKFVVDAGAR
jgi:type II secretory pathway pseudopilin PulG